MQDPPARPGGWRGPPPRPRTHRAPANEVVGGGVLHQSPDFAQELGHGAPCAAATAGPHAAAPAADRQPPAPQTLRGAEGRAPPMARARGREQPSLVRAEVPFASLQPSLVPLSAPCPYSRWRGEAGCHVTSPPSPSPHKFGSVRMWYCQFS